MSRHWAGRRGRRPRPAAGEQIDAEARTLPQVRQPGRRRHQLAVVGLNPVRIDIRKVVRRKIELGGFNALCPLPRNRQVPVIGERSVLVGRRQLDPAIGDDAVVEGDGDDRRAELTEIDAVACEFVIEIDTEFEAVEQILRRPDVKQMGAFDLQRVVPGLRRGPRSGQPGAIEVVQLDQVFRRPDLEWRRLRS